ncbi:hypothetical protein, partial [Streptomyces sp. NPDC059742]|uniref:hypothetical protein n=1 Tax=Streptomyces sp. NPDC059742 TaxID=3346927 RepID=UPI00364B07A7
MTAPRPGEADGGTTAGPSQEQYRDRHPVAGHGRAQPVTAQQDQRRAGAGVLGGVGPGGGGRVRRGCPTGVSVSFKTGARGL